MNDIKPETPGASGKSRTAAWTTGLIFGLSMGLIDLTVNFALGKTTLLSPYCQLAALLTTASVSFVLFMALAALPVALLGRVARFDAARLLVSVAVFGGLLFALLSTADLIYRNPTLNSVVRIVFFALISLFIAALIHVAGKSWAHDEQARQKAVSICMAVPLVLFETLVLCVLLFDILDLDLGSPRPAATILLTILWMAAVAITARLAANTLGPTRTRGAVMVLGICLIAGLVLFGFLEHRARARTLDAETNQHAVKRIILLTVDTLRTDALSCYGSETNRTPHIDRLAGESILFENALAPSPWTLPSFASMFTGLSVEAVQTPSPHSLLQDNYHTLAEHMAENGYLTAAVGYNAILTRTNLSQGFALYDFYPAKRFGTSLGARILEKAFPARFRRERNTGELTDLAVDLLDSVRDKSFFLWVHYFDPHLPYAPPARWLPAGEPAPRIGAAFDRKLDLQTGHLILTSDEKQWVRRLYESEVRYVDENIGRLIDKLKALNIYEDSLIVFASDHGEEFWEHGGFEHGHTLYNELLRVPLIFKLPQSSNKGRVRQPVAVQALLPTVLDLGRLPYEPSSISARSLAPLLQDPEGTADDSDPVFASGVLFYDKKEAVVFGRHKFIRSLVQGKEELYDLGADPGETRSVGVDLPQTARQALDLLQVGRAEAERMLEYYGVTDMKTGPMDRDTLESLKALGYVQ